MNTGHRRPRCSLHIIKPRESSASIPVLNLSHGFVGTAGWQHRINEPKRAPRRPFLQGLAYLRSRTIKETKEQKLKQTKQNRHFPTELKSKERETKEELFREAAEVHKAMCPNAVNAFNNARLPAAFFQASAARLFMRG